MESKPTRQAFGEALLEIAEENSDFIVLDADISKSTCTSFFHQKYPERAYNFGIAEQNMFGVAAGMATTGLPVIATTYAVFASMRALEQIRTFICYPNLNVKIVASHGGLQVSSDGVSHQATEDLAIMRAMPNMTVIQPADQVATEKALKAALEHQGPVYLRLMRNAVPVVYKDGVDLELGKGIVLRDSEQAVCSIIATGLMVGKALTAAEQLSREGIEVRVIDMHTLKPIDKDLIIESATRTGAIVTAEDHNIVGGLGGAVAEILSEERPTPLVRVGIQDTFGESGDPEELFSEYHMNVSDLVMAVKKAVSRK